MGFITNQWLMGNPVRKRSFNPVQGLIQAYKPEGTRWEDRGVVLGIELQHKGGDRQVMYFTQAEIDKMFPKISGTVTQSVRLNMALTAIGDVSDSELLSFLAKLLAKRAAIVEAKVAK